MPWVMTWCGHLLDVAVEEPRVVHPGLLGQRLDAGTRGERGARLVEADVPVRADPEQLEVDAAGLGQRPVVRLAGGEDVLGGAVGAHERVLAQPERLDDLAQHHRTVGLGVPGRQPDVLVELADPGPGGVHRAGRDLGRERLVDGQRGRAGRHAEQGVGLAADQGGHGLRDELAACLGVRDDDNFHAGPADLEMAACGIDQSSRGCRLREGSRRFPWWSRSPCAASRAAADRTPLRGAAREVGCVRVRRRPGAPRRHLRGRPGPSRGGAGPGAGRGGTRSRSGPYGPGRRGRGGGPGRCPAPGVSSGPRCRTGPSARPAP